MVRTGRPRKESHTPLGAAIRARRLRKRRTVEECAAAAGVKPSRWYDWELGRGTPSIEGLPAIAAAVGCKPAALLE